MVKSSISRIIKMMWLMGLWAERAADAGAFELCRDHNVSNPPFLDTSAHYFDATPMPFLILL